MNLIDGKAIAQEELNETAVSARILADDLKRWIKLVCILVGDNPASKTYVNAKLKACRKYGVLAQVINMDAKTHESQLLEKVRELNADDEVDGILIQLPLPKHIDTDLIIETIDPFKDVDGLTTQNLGMLLSGTPRLIPATPLGILRMLERSSVQIEGKEAVIVGRSRLVGMPIAQLLAMRGATVTICHSKTADLASNTRRADILIVAVGIPNLISSDMVKEGAVVIDVGINRVEDASTKTGHRLVGDVNFEEVSKVASAITPVPGGVGPMTVAMLVNNVVSATKLRKLHS